MSLGIYLADNFDLPESWIRSGIRRLVKKRLQQERNKYAKNGSDASLEKLLSSVPISTASAEANEQHYEVPAELFEIALGNQLKYSCCNYDKGAKDLNQAEIDALNQIIERADIKDNQEVLELGCGWGSFCLFAASKFPNSNFTSVSNSKSQADYINTQAKKRGIENLKIITSDINQLDLNGKKFDRLVSVEMFEHLRNHELLFKKIATEFLKDDAKMFVHIFCHQQFTYLYDEKQKNEWMAKYFFTGGIMPAKNLFYRYNKHLEVVRQWDLNGTNYQKTADHWADNLKENKVEAIKILENIYGKGQGRLWYRRWLIFFLACAEMFGYDNGNEWLVSHYLFRKNI